MNILTKIWDSCFPDLFCCCFEYEILLNSTTPNIYESIRDFSELFVWRNLLFFASVQNNITAIVTIDFTETKQN